MSRFFRKGARTSDTCKVPCQMYITTHEKVNHNTHYTPDGKLDISRMIGSTARHVTCKCASIVLASLRSGRYGAHFCQRAYAEKCGKKIRMPMVSLLKEFDVQPHPLYHNPPLPHQRRMSCYA